MLFEQVKEIIYRAFTKLAGDINTINKKLDSVQLYQNYVDTELDYCFMKGGIEGLAPGANTFLNSRYTYIDTNMEINENNSVLLKKGRKYKITGYIMSNTNGFDIYIVDETKTRLKTAARGYGATSSYSTSSTEIIFYQPEKDIYINYLTPSNITIWFDCSYFTVEEIGRSTTTFGDEGGGSIIITQPQIDEAIEKALEELNADVRTD